MKYAGCMMFFLAAAGIGGYASCQLEKRRRQLMDLRRAILLLSREIDYQLTPLSEAMLHISKKTEKPWSYFFEQVGKNLENTGGTEYELERFVEHALQSIERFHPWKKDLEILKSLGKGIGQLDKKMQVIQLDLAQEEIRQAEKDALEEQQTKGQLYKSLGICMGALGVIILL